MRVHIRVSCLGLLVISGMFLFSCKQSPDKSLRNHPLTVVEAKGYVVPKDSIAPPKILPRNNPRIVPAIKNKMIPAQSNVHDIDSTKTSYSIIPEVCTPGQDGFLLPEKIPAIGIMVAAGLPSVVSASEVKGADPNPNNFSSFNQLKGLNNTRVQYLFEDSSGNLWMGTKDNGVSKYDGRNFTTFTKDEGLCGNDVTSIAEDENGNMWFGSWGGGISKYDGKSFTNFNTKEGLNSDYVVSVFRDSRGDIWIGSWNGGVSKYDGESFTSYAKKEGLGENNVTSILEDQKGNLWLGIDGNGLSRYDGESFHNFYSKAGIYLDVITCVIENKDGTLWVGTQSGGLVKYDGGLFTRYGEEDGLPNNFIYDIKEDKSGNLWISTWKGGVTKYDGKSFTNYPVLEGLQNNTVESILGDKNGNLWFGDDGGGISKYNSQTFKHFTGEDGLILPDIRVVTGDKNDNLWIGTYGTGVFKYDGKDLIQITEKFPGYGVLATCILQDSRGDMWFGTWANGVTKYDGEDFIHFPEMREINRCRILSMLEDSKGNFWFGTDFGGVVKYEGHTHSASQGKFLQYGVEQGLSHNMVTSMAEDEKGGLWFGTLGGGATLYDGRNFTHFTTKEGMASDRILSISKDLNGSLWFGTDGQGVTRYDGRNFTYFSTDQGLGGNTVKSILEDSRGDIWFSTDMGLSKLSFNKLAEISEPNELGDRAENDVLFSNYSYEDGFLGIGPNTGKTIYEDKNRAIWVGANDRLTVFHPDDLKKDTIPTRIELTNLQLFNEAVNWAELNDKQDSSFRISNGVIVTKYKLDGVSKWHNVPQNLSLSHKNNTLTFNYAGASLRAPHKLNYQYQLEGFEENWNAKTTSQEANYGNLPWGDYTFKVKAINGDGVSSDAVRYAFAIRPPWWTTWWAYLGYFVIGAGSLFAFYRFQLQRRLQKAEAIRLKELDAVKTRLYTNITHEFRTPLTVILGMAQQVSERPKEYLKDGLEMIIRNGQNLLSLVNQILDLSKLESGQLNLKYQQADILAYLKYIAESFDSLAEKKGVEIHFLPDLEKLLMDFDEVRFQQIVSNLLSNAIKFTPKGGHIYISTRTAGNDLNIKVRDTGIGISEADIPHVFDRFYQADGSHSRPGEGTGIGLELTRELIRLMQGSISVKSTKGKGTEFEIVLPITHNAALLETKKVGSLQGADFSTDDPIEDEVGGVASKCDTFLAKDTTIGKKPLVLIADDNEDVRTYVASCLQKDYTIAVAKNGQECEDIAFDITPDLIVLDVMMPFKDGFEVCSTLKRDQRTSHIPIIMLTAKADLESRLEGLAQKADDYLTKPFHKKELLLRTKNLLELRQMLQQYYRSSLEGGLSVSPLKRKQEGNTAKTAVEGFSSKTAAQSATYESIPFASSLDNAFVAKVRKEIETNLDDPDFDVEKLCRAVALSHSQVHRKLSALTGLSATHFIRYVRLIRAKEMMVDSRFKIAAIAIDCGFNDPAYFSRVFKKEFGLTPQKWRNQNSGV